MGIHNIHILHDHSSDMARKVQEYIEAKRIVEHRAGKHPFGSMRRDCPLCVSRK